MFRKKRVESKKPSWIVTGKQKRSEKVKRWMKGKRSKVLFLILLLVAAAIMERQSGVISVQKVIVTAEQTGINTEAVKRLIEPELLGKNIFFVSESGIEKRLKEESPEIASVKITRHLPNTLEIEVKGFEIIAIVKHEGKRFYLSSKGLLAPFDDRNLSLPIFEFMLRPKKVHEEKQEAKPAATVAPALEPA